jgi:HKD family nuclease
MFFFQPNDGMFGALLLSELGKDGYREYDHLTIYVAYAKYSGVARVAESLESFIAASGRVDAVVGINQRQTTYEALDLLAALGSNVQIFYDEDDNKTFHPKVFWLRNNNTHAQWVAIGSNNLTAGGLYSNYEMAVVSTSSLSTDDGAAQAASLQGMLRGHEASGHLLQIDRPEVLKSLLERGYIVTEAEARAKSQGERSSARSGRREKGDSLFPRSAAISLPGIPEKFRLAPPDSPIDANSVVPPSPEAPSAPQPAAHDEGGAKQQGVSSGPTVSAPKQVPVEPRGFWKRLTPSDVSLTSSPGQMIIPRQYLSFFPPLGTLKNTTSGGKQGDVFFDVEYHESGNQPRIVENARAIWYEPAPSHKRQNVDLRFTFRNREVLESLSAGDVLEFVPASGGDVSMVITHIAAADVQSSGDYGLII